MGVDTMSFTIHPKQKPSDNDAKWISFLRILEHDEKYANNYYKDEE